MNSEDQIEATSLNMLPCRSLHWIWCIFTL